MNMFKLKNSIRSCVIIIIIIIIITITIIIITRLVTRHMSIAMKQARMVFLGGHPA